jgi:WD40 repeat protein
MQRTPVTDTTAAALNANGEVQAAGFADGSIVVRHDGAERPLGVQGRVRHLALNAGGTVLAAVADGATAVSVFNLANAGVTPVSVAGTGEPVRRIALHPIEPVLALAACADPDCQRTEVRVHDAATGRQISTLALRPGFNPTVLAFGPAVRDGNPVIAVGGQNRTVWLFDWRKGNVLAGPLTGHVSAISAIAFGGDGLLATGEEDQDGDPQVILWDISQGQRLGGAFIGHTDGIAALAFGSNGLASAGRDGRVMLWPVGEYLNSGTRRACQLANRDMTAEEWDRYLPEQKYRETCAAGSR